MLGVKTSLRRVPVSRRVEVSPGPQEHDKPVADPRVRRREPSHAKTPPDRCERPYHEVEETEKHEGRRPEHDRDRNDEDEQRRDEHARPEEDDHAAGYQRVM